MQPFGKVAVDVAPTDVVHCDGAGLDVEASDFGRCVHQNFSNFGVMRGGVDESECDVIDDRSISAGIKCWRETSDLSLIHGENQIGNKLPE